MRKTEEYKARAAGKTSLTLRLIYMWSNSFSQNRYQYLSKATNEELAGQ